MSTTDTRDNASGATEGVQQQPSVRPTTATLIVAAAFSGAFAGAAGVGCSYALDAVDALNSRLHIESRRWWIQALVFIGSLPFIYLLFYLVLGGVMIWFVACLDLLFKYRSWSWRDDRHRVSFAVLFPLLFPLAFGIGFTFHHANFKLSEGRTDIMNYAIAPLIVAAIAGLVGWAVARRRQRKRQQVRVETSL